MSSSEPESDAADLEVPDRQTAEAADWLRKHNLELDTPTFWLFAGLLANYKAKPAPVPAQPVCNCTPCGDVHDIWCPMAQILRTGKVVPAQPPALALDFADGEPISKSISFEERTVRLTDSAVPAQPPAPLRDPTEKELSSPIFNAIWNAIKKWDICRDGSGLYAGVTGTDVCTIIDAFAPIISAEIHMIEQGAAPASQGENDGRRPRVADTSEGYGNRAASLDSNSDLCTNSDPLASPPATAREGNWDESLRPDFERFLQEWRISTEKRKDDPNKNYLNYSTRLAYIAFQAGAALLRAKNAALEEELREAKRRYELADGNWKLEIERNESAESEARSLRDALQEIDGEMEVGWTAETRARIKQRIREALASQPSAASKEG